MRIVVIGLGSMGKRSLMEVIADYLYRTNPKFEDIKRNLEG